MQTDIKLYLRKYCRKYYDDLWKVQILMNKIKNLQRNVSDQVEEIMSLCYCFTDTECLFVRF